MLNALIYDARPIRKSAQMSILSRFLDLFLGGYEAAQERASIEVVGRYSRGNVAVQNGFILDEAAAARIKDEGDKAWADIKAARAHAGG